jgi:cytochrome c
MRNRLAAATAAFVLVLFASVTGRMETEMARAADAGDPTRGTEIFSRACGACHALEPERNMTGPSLAALWGRKAGSLESFHRYSPALKSATVVWDDGTLDAWIANPAKAIPGNRMTFPGIKDATVRADLLAYLKSATAPGATPSASQGGMMSGDVPDLKQVGADQRVQAISYCGDTYHLTMADGSTYDFWERNLRFKTDSSDKGPPAGSPAIVGAGMAGDRASIIFAAPAEISSMIKPGC